EFHQRRSESRSRSACLAWCHKFNGRGGIRTHGGFPHARFRVECLKPDSATLPSKQKKRRTRNVQHTTSNATVSRLGVQRWALDVERLSSGKPPASHAPPAVGKRILSLQRRARP